MGYCASAGQMATGGASLHKPDLLRGEASVSCNILHKLVLPASQIPHGGLFAGLVELDIQCRGDKVLVLADSKHISLDAPLSQEP